MEKFGKFLNSNSAHIFLSSDAEALIKRSKQLIQDAEQVYAESLAIRNQIQEFREKLDGYRIRPKRNRTIYFDIE